jgi:hypothetical protein
VFLFPLTQDRNNQETNKSDTFWKACLENKGGQKKENVFCNNNTEAWNGRDDQKYCAVIVQKTSYLVSHSKDLPAIDYL